MKTALLWFFVALAYTASAVPIESKIPEDRVYSRYIEFPDGEGVMHTVDLEAEPEEDVDPTDHQYLLFTRRNPTTAQTLVMNNTGSIIHSHFNHYLPTVVIAHGWLSNQESNVNSAIRDVLLDKSNVNVIVLDWRKLAVTNYVTAVRGVPAAGAALGQFLAFLKRTTRASFSSMHLIGFSLGAHLVGNAGRQLSRQIGRITALDPAGPLWYLNSDRINANDAIYVEAIHTDGGYEFGSLGLGFDVGDADFYVNGGISQPGCFTNICNHNRAWRYFAATVTYNHIIGNECESILQVTLNRCRGQQLHMGNDDPKKYGSGKYRSNTKRRYPY